MGYYVYKYYNNNELIYIGKTINLNQRISSHKSESKFKQYCSENNIKYEDFIIKFYSFSTCTEMNGVELLLINKYKPLLNETDKNIGYECEVECIINIQEQTFLFENRYKHSNGNVAKKNIIYIRSRKGERDFDDCLDEWNRLKTIAEWASTLDSEDERIDIDDMPKNRNGYPLIEIIKYKPFTANGIDSTIYKRINLCTCYDRNKKIYKLDLPVNKIKELIPIISRRMNELRNELLRFEYSKDYKFKKDKYISKMLDDGYIIDYCIEMDEYEFETIPSNYFEDINNTVSLKRENIRKREELDNFLKKLQKAKEADEYIISMFSVIKFSNVNILNIDEKYIDFVDFCINYIDNSIIRTRQLPVLSRVTNEIVIDINQYDYEQISEITRWIDWICDYPFSRRCLQEYMSESKLKDILDIIAKAIQLNDGFKHVLDEMKED